MSLNGNDLRAVQLEDRKRRLGNLIERPRYARLLPSQTLDDGERLLAECGKRGLEGIVAKQPGSRPGPCCAWGSTRLPLP
jgi:ATP-dependent DNA ligase